MMNPGNVCIKVSESCILLGPQKLEFSNQHRSSETVKALSSSLAPRGVQQKLQQVDTSHYVIVFDGFVHLM